MGSHMNKFSERHILAWVRFVWVIMREHPSTCVTCRWVTKKCKSKHNFGCILPMCLEAPVDMDLHLIWHSLWSRRSNHLWQTFWWSVEGCRFCGGGSKFAVSHWQSQSPLTQGWRYGAVCDKVSGSFGYLSWV